MRLECLSDPHVEALIFLSATTASVPLTQHCAWCQLSARPSTRKEMGNTH